MTWKSSWNPDELGSGHAMRMHVHVHALPPVGYVDVVRYPTGPVRLRGLVPNVRYQVMWYWSPTYGVMALTRRPQGWSRRAIRARLRELVHQSPRSTLRNWWYWRNA